MASSYRSLCVGLSSGNIPHPYHVGFFSNSFAVQDGHDYCWFSGKPHDFEWPNGAIKTEWHGEGDVIGCGLSLNLQNEVSIFFTGNGILLGKQIPISPSVDYLFPTLNMTYISVEANFGNDPAKPFAYNI